MTLRAMASVTLQISFLIYLIMGLTQIHHNIRRKSTEGLSWIMHLILLSSSLCDMGYGIGTSMPWQYYSVSLLGTGMLSLQHYQFGFYRPGCAPRSYLPASVALIALTTAIFTCFLHRSQHLKL